MNVRITRHETPQRTDLYSGVRRVYSDDRTLFLGFARTSPQTRPVITFRRRDVAEIALDDEGGIE